MKHGTKTDLLRRIQQTPQLARESEEPPVEHRLEVVGGERRDGIAADDDTPPPS